VRRYKLLMDQFEDLRKAAQTASQAQSDLEQALKELKEAIELER
jgi:hypothetical protein